MSMSAMYKGKEEVQPNPPVWACTSFLLAHYGLCLLSFSHSISCHTSYIKREKDSLLALPYLVHIKMTRSNLSINQPLPKRGSL